MTTVGLAKGGDRFAIVHEALACAGEDVRLKVHGTVGIKVNTVVQGSSLANTQPEALAAVLDFLAPLGAERVVVGEASGAPMELFDSEPFRRLRERYRFEFLDFNSTGYEAMELESIDGAPLPVRITRAAAMFDCLISLSVPKAHSDAVLTLSGKNMMGFLETEQMWRIHGVQEFGRDDNIVACTRTIHRNLRTLLRRVRPDIAVLDCFHSFEAGTVPQCARGDYVEPHLAFAGADFVAVDTVAALALGFDPGDIGYLVYCVRDGYGIGDPDRIEVRGTPIAEARYALKPPPRVQILKAWA